MAFPFYPPADPAPRPIPLVPSPLIWPALCRGAVFTPLPARGRPSRSQERGGCRAELVQSWRSWLAGRPTSTWLPRLPRRSRPAGGATEATEPRPMAGRPSPAGCQRPSALPSRAVRPPRTLGMNYRRPCRNLKHKHGERARAPAQMEPLLLQISDSVYVDGCASNSLCAWGGEALISVIGAMF